MLVAYSMLQMVREQVLQESMTRDDIILVSAPALGPGQPFTPGGNLSCPEHCAGASVEQLL